MKIVAKYMKPYEAHLAKGMLQAEGIMSEVLNENFPYPGLGFIPGMEIQLVVNDEDYDRALELINAAAESSAE